MNSNRRVNFDEIKARADFRTVLTHYGLTPGRGVQCKICCPFHDDAEPSCSINLEEKVFHCFGAGCGVEGNVLDFVHRMEVRGGDIVTIRQAAITLAGICGIPLEATGKPKGARKAKGGPGSPTAEDGPPSPAKAPPDARGGQGGASGEAPEPKPNKPLGFELKLDPSHPYLAERGVSAALVERFGLGYCEKGIMAGRVCIPIHNPDGKLVAYAGRWAGPHENLPEGKGKYELPKGFRKELELFNLHRARECRHLVVCEGYFGAIRLHGERIPAVALMGSSIAEEQVELLRSHCPNLRFVTVMLDGDAGGRAAADVVITKLARHWWARIVHLADGDQPDTVDRAELGRLLGRGEQ